MIKKTLTNAALNSDLLDEFPLCTDFRFRSNCGFFFRIIPCHCVVNNIKNKIFQPYPLTYRLQYHLSENQFHSKRNINVLGMKQLESLKLQTIYTVKTVKFQR